ncbi:competence protein ComK [Pallidibacillus thermolactis]|jgi:competence transcription factor ComK|uniref:competence protein ComK n=1 Tax=Pallidibacillus thermolactis TaxID=251051 RepID=UPI0021D916F9|nr:competence protein ComK [Pallidibacillus thermolactis]MCU9599693.1 competence protein ComK [Pallidibacillus thermolactis subsp. kokeshiiformis]MED1674665.1 competence protein ComK [Pallidibacillus thermolactis subsp. kokeshiiformis]
MKENYYISKNTYVFQSNFDKNGFENSKVFEKNREINVRKSPLHIVKESYERIASDYEGAVRGARAILNKRNQVPVVYSALSEIVLLHFPSIDRLGKVWVINKYIQHIKPYEGNKTIIQMDNGHSIPVGMKFHLVQDRCIQATYLQTVAQQRHP